MNHAVPPVSHPGTGKLEHRLHVLNTAKKIGICNIPQKLMNGLYPHCLYSASNFMVALRISTNSPLRRAFFVSSISAFCLSAMYGRTEMLRVVLSISGNKATRRITVSRIIEPHQGSWVLT